MVAAISDAWGVHPNRDGKTVWFRLRLPVPTEPAIGADGVDAGWAGQTFGGP